MKKLSLLLVKPLLYFNMKNNKTKETEMKSVNEAALTIRRTWGELKPVSRPFKSKKDYNRKDKSWKKDY